MDLEFSANCRYCSQKFQIVNQQQLYCCDLCWASEGYSLCAVCGLEFSNPNNNNTCSEACASKYIDLWKKPGYKHLKKTCFICQTLFEGERDYCSLACAHGFEKEKVHLTTDFFETCLDTILQSRSKIVPKPWGGEIHIVNHNDYCLKYLVFYKNKQFSHHVHNIKKELWHCLIGGFECVLEEDGVKNYFIMKAGDKVEIKPGMIHQLQALENSIIVEVSTRDFPEDSIRVLPGIN